MELREFHRVGRKKGTSHVVDEGDMVIVNDEGRLGMME